MNAATASKRSLRALSGLNFFLADVRDGLGPFLGVFLVGQGWAPDQIGYVLTIGGLAGMLATTPMGIVADSTRAKRTIVCVCAVLVIVASLAILASPDFIVVAGSQIASGIAGAAIGPVIAGMTLGLVGQRGLAHRLGQNEAFNHAGNVFAAAAAGLLAFEFGIVAVFALMIAMAVGSIVMALTIRPHDIDHQRARGLGPEDETDGHQPARLIDLVRDRPLMIVAVTLMLFHLGNAAMLPLLGQAAATAEVFNPAAYTAITIIVAQLTMIPMALLAAKWADTRGYWIVFVAALAVLPVRGLIAALWDVPWAVIPVQILDGVGAGLLGVATPGIVARILRGSGHVNAGLGAVMTVQGLGAAFSTTLAGVVAARFGYGAAFGALGAAAAIGLVLWLVATPIIKRAIAR